MDSPAPAPTDDPPRPTGTRGMSEADLERKRARDRKAQQNMRLRAKAETERKNQEISFLAQHLQLEREQTARLNARIQAQDGEIDGLRMQNAALRLELLGQQGGDQGAVQDAEGPKIMSRFLPNNTPPECEADRLLEGLVIRLKQEIATHSVIGPPGSSPQDLHLFDKIDLRPLLEKSVDATNGLSNTFARAVLSFTGINSLSDQIAVHYVISIMIRWKVLEDEQSYLLLPDWLRPISAQLNTPHAPWIDCIPWPSARKHLVEHPELTSEAVNLIFDNSTVDAWSSSTPFVVDQDAAVTVINPEFEALIRNLASWNVGAGLREKLPDLAQVILQP